MKVDTKRRQLLIGATAAGLSALAAGVAGNPQATVVKVVAKRFDFTPDVIRLKKGVPVLLELTTSDIVMGFNAPDFGVRSDILPGTVSRVRFTPAKTGEFTFYCDIFCGAGHESMNGTIAVS